MRTNFATCITFLVAFAALPSELLAEESRESIRLPAKENFHLFLLAGQSNMAGRGKIDAEDKEPHPRIVMFSKEQRWVPAIAPLHFDKRKIVGVGLGRSFAKSVADKVDASIVIGLIPCAVGGSPISSWEPGGFHEQTKSHPYDDAMRRAKLAIEYGSLKAVLWHQGESDSNDEKSELYEEKLHQLIARFRREFDAPQLPFIAGQMGQFAERPWSDAKKQVDSVHQSLPKKVTLTRFVNSDGLKHKGDEVHFDAESYRELGRRYAKAYLTLR